MAKEKSNPKQYKVPQWLSANEDSKEGRFIMVGNSMLLHGLKDVKAGPCKLYLAMCMECGGKLSFGFSHGDAKKYGIPSTSFDRWIKELIEAGLITRVWSEEMGQYEKAVFKFKLDWKKGKSV